MVLQTRTRILARSNHKNKNNCYSNQFYLNKTKNIIYVEDNVINMFEKYQLQPPYGFLEDF